jgi:hypothetical protein
MNHPEELLYAKGLEHAYSSLLLGEENQALGTLEELISLTRTIRLSRGTRIALADEVHLLRRVCGVCWPDGAPAVLAEGLPEDASVRFGQLASAVLSAVLDLEHQMKRPAQIALVPQEHGVQYRIGDGREIWMQGVIFCE